MGALLGLAGLAAVSVESVSFGHQHLAGGHTLHHHHFFFGPHEHPGTQPNVSAYDLA